MDKRKEANRIVREKISAATFSLMWRKSFSSITVSEIIREAGVARVSFYRNFVSKEEVVRTRLAGVIGAAAELTQWNKRLDSYDCLLKFWKRMEEEKELLSRFCTAELSELLLDCLFRGNQNAQQRRNSPKEDYYFSAYIGALYSALRKWLSNGCLESPEMMTRMFYGFWRPNILLSAE